MKNNNYDRFKYLTGILTALALAWGPSVQAKDNFAVTPFVQKASSERPILHLVIKDVEPHSGVCDYTVTEFQYIRSLRVLVLNMERESCLNDAYGKSEGDFYWRIPEELQTEGSKLCVSVNQGQPFALSYDGTSGKYVMDNSQSCEAL